MPAPKPSTCKKPCGLSFLFEICLGAFFALALLKFGNPVIMDKYVGQPASLMEWVIDPWPGFIAHGMVFALGIFGLFAFRKPAGLPKLLILLPAAWFLWQVISATQSVAAALSEDTVIHFLGCTVCFYLGLLGIGCRDEIPGFCVALICGFIIVLGVGFEQHFGGLAETQKYWMIYVYPTVREIPPGFLKKMTSTRIFSTLFYPNALAGGILLVLPVVLGAIWEARRRFTSSARVFLMASFGLAAAACLFWSGSKAGWLIFLLQGICLVLIQPVSKRLKFSLILAVALIGLTGFTIKYLGFFKKGATSVVARYDYWQAAVATALDKPVFGNGPGTFGKAYQLRKRPESEMAQLAHNDYLQQASDSGLPGFFLFTGFVAWAMTRAWGNIRLASEGGWFRLAVWLGLLGWAVQSALEFGLYIPAIGWLAFALIGWLLAQTAPSNGVDKPSLAR